MQLKESVYKAITEEGFSLKVGQQIVKTVGRYSTPSGFCDTLSYIIHRIKNFFLSLICCSDWQRARRSIKNSGNLAHFLKGNDTSKINPVLKRLIETSKKHLFKEMAELQHAYPEKSLQLWVKMQNGKNTIAELVEVNALAKKLQTRPGELKKDLKVKIDQANALLNAKEKELGVAPIS